jgi:hypothetical protein
MRRFVQSAILSGLLSFGVAVHASVDIILDDAGKLAGARGLEVDGTLYDVDFESGQIFDIFEEDNFFFESYEDGIPFFEALDEFVFTGIYDNDPFQTRGCGVFQVGNYNVCTVITPYEWSLENGNSVTYSVALYNAPDPLFGEDFFSYDDYVAYDHTYRYIDSSIPLDTSYDPFHTFANWSASSKTSVPELDAAGLLQAFALLFGTVVVARESKRRKA